MEHKSKNIVAGIIGAVVSVLALGLFIYRLRGHWGAVLDALRQVNVAYIVPAVGLLVALYILRIARWQLFLRPISSVQWFSAMSATVIGFAVNNILPARLGELVRPYLICKREKVDFSHGLATVGLARMFDLMGLALLLVLAGLIVSPEVTPMGIDEKENVLIEEHEEESPTEPGEYRGGTKGQGQKKPEGKGIVTMVWRGGIIASCGAAMVIGVLLALALWPEPVLRLGERMISFLPEAWHARFEGVLASLLEALGCLKSWRGVLLGLSFSGLLWLCQGFSTWMLARGLDLDVGIGAAFLVTIAVAAAVAIPQAPGYLGTFHLAAALVAEGFEVSTGQAGAFAMLMWLINVVPVTIVGIGFLVHEGLNLGELQEESERLEADSDEQDLVF